MKTMKTTTPKCEFSYPTGDTPCAKVSLSSQKKPPSKRNK